MISFARISKQYGRQLLFVDASFQLNPGEKVGLVGPNGAGKTTLFRLIVGEESADEGEISVPKKLTIGYFRQDVEEMTGRSVLDEAIAGSLAAFSSARIIRSFRNSAESTRSAEASGVPYFSVWIMVVTTPRTESRLMRLARFSNARRRSVRKPSSIEVNANSSPSSG